MTAALLRRSVIPAFLILPAVIPAWPIAGQAPVAAFAPADAVSLQQVGEYLQSMDRRLRLRLSRLAVSDRPAAGASAAEVERFRRQLRSLENRLQVWQRNGVPGRDAGAKQAAVLIGKVRALRPLVDSLERAAEHPQAFTGLARSPARRAGGTGGAPAPASTPAPGPAAGALKTSAQDDCADALPIGNGTYTGDTSGATPDGQGCYGGEPDVWFAYSSPVTVEVVADTFGSTFDTVLSVYTGCPGTLDNEIACNDDAVGTQSAVGFQAEAGVQYLIRVAGCCGDSGPFTLNIGPGGAIEGTVTDAETGEPVVDATLEAWTGDGQYAGHAFTDLEGNYVVPGLSSGDHFLHISAPGYLPEVFDDLPCPPSLGCQPWTGTPIPVMLGVATAGVDVALHQGGSISGKVTRALTGDAIRDLAVQIWDGQGNEVGYAYTSEEGIYSLSGLYAGTYYATTSNDRYRDELYDDIPCPGGGYGGCDPTTGYPIEVGFGDTTGGIDFALERLGRITGEVTEATTGGPALSVFVDAWDEDGQFAGNGFVFGTGLYEIGGLDAGNYHLTTDSPVHFDELYDDLPCEPDCDPTAGTPVEVSLNATTPGIDFALERLGAIAGTVTNQATGSPIAAVVYIWDSSGNEAAYGFADSGTGSYLAEGLVPGTYTATADASINQDELYDDMPCPHGDCDPTSGTPIEVSLNTVTGGVDFALKRLGVIMGRVRQSITGHPIGGATVDVYAPGGLFITSGFTDSAGYYIAVGLDPGTHFAVAHAYDHVGEVWANMPCTEGCDLASGTPIETRLDVVTDGIEFTLDRLGSISGHVSHAGRPVADARVSIYDSSGFFRRDAYSDPAGDYTVGGLSPESHFALVDHAQLDSELYDGIPCADGCEPTAGTPIAVDLNATTAGIDFDLGYCTPDATSLCLTGDRFRVEATWEDPQNATGPGQAEGLTTDAGYFWFFNPGNIELMVKILDVCIEPHNRFWVFGAGLTDVGVELTVTDELTGDVRSYANPLGTPYQPVLDTLAFATCDAGFTMDAGGGVAEPPGSPSLWQPLIRVGTKTQCSPSATGLCLGGGRFLAELVWQAPNGDGGPAPAVQLTDESGYFWFGSADNVEVVVKVLDACNLAPFNNYWVFAAGLTNFEVTLRVTDTETGEMQEYFNPQGRTYQAITDTDAFDTCM